MGDLHLIEKGRVLNQKNEGLIRAALNNISAALASLGNNDATPAKKAVKKATKEIADNAKDVKESETFSTADLAMLLSAAIRDQLGSDYYLQDVFPDEGLVVYSYGWQRGFYEATYSVDDTGVVDLGDPVEVSRKVTYIAKSDNNTDPTTAVDTTSAIVSDTLDESVRILEGDPIKLVEAAVSPTGETLLKLIAPGWGSSGYYSESVLQQAAKDKVFKAGLHNLIDHPTQLEETQRPEGSINALGSVLLEDAQYLDHPKHGKGLYAKAMVKPDFRENLNAIAPYIGTSIRARGSGKIGEAEGRKGVIVESIKSAQSVDYVTLPGAGGKVINLMESAKQRSNGDDMADTALLEKVTLLEKRLEAQDTRASVDRILQDQRYANAPIKVRMRVAESIVTNPPRNAEGMVDHAKLIEAVEAKITSELTYLNEATGFSFGQVRDMGSTSTAPAVDLDKELAAVLGDSVFGLSESAVKTAVHGRD